MKVLVIGQGGREHALVWKIAESRLVDKIYCAPGNGGISEIAQCVDLKTDDLGGLLNFAKKEKIDLSISGPEIPLCMGIVDLFNKEGLRIFGPQRELAKLEGSKIFAKDLMKRFGIPTAEYKVFSNAADAKAYLKKIKFPAVIKADGLCAGKGVVVAKSIDEAEVAVTDMMVNRIFGPSGENIIIEEALYGEEASIIALFDGKDFVLFESSQDHKRVFDSDAGPNTGGMGAYSPAPVVGPAQLEEISETVFKPVMEGLRKKGFFYKGVLYAGIMITEKGPQVLEFNVRFGDPETQALIPRLKTDLVDLMLRCIDGSLGSILLEWDKRHCVSVVIASGGYPGDYKTGLPIFGLEKAREVKGVNIFHAGTKKDISTGGYFTAGGRVLNVTALGDTLKSAIKSAYTAAELVRFDNMHFRKDIGKKALEKIHA